MSKIGRVGLYLRAAVTIVAVGFVVHVLYGNAGQVAQAMREGHLSLHLGYLGASYLCLGLQLISRALTWHYITLRLGAAISVRKAIVSWLLSLLGRNLPGRVFVLAGRVYLYGQYGVGAGRVTLGFMLEVASSLAASMLLLFSCLLITNTPADALLRRLQPLLAAGPIVIIIALHPRVLERFVNLVLRRLGRDPTRLSLGYRDILFFVALSYVNWALLGAGFFFLTKAIVNVEWQHLPFIMGTFAFAMIAGFVAVFTPAGLGVREGVVIAVLQTAMPAGVAAVVALAARLWVTVGEFGAAGIVLLFDRLLPEASPKAETDAAISGPED